jgi:hypothetical protein
MPDGSDLNTNTAARTTSPSPSPRHAWFQRRLCWVPTWKAWLLFLVLGIVFCAAAFKWVPRYLAQHNPLPGDLLVVEGWVPDYALETALAEFKHGPYKTLYVTGGPLEHGAPLSEHKSFAELGAATLRKLGADATRLRAVPAPVVHRDRTYASAVTLKKELSGKPSISKQLTVISVGPHSRRTRLLFQKAFGAEWKIGVISVMDQSYDFDRWWQSSEGVRTMIGELIAYSYVRLVFRPPAQ